MLACPFDGEETLSQIVDSNEINQQLATAIVTFQKTLSPEQRQAFNVIDDLFTHLITLTQHETLKRIHCPNCSLACTTR